MPDFKSIYLNQAAQYDLMVSREDYQGNLLPALNAIRPLSGLDVVEVGAGTGRLTTLIAPLVQTIRAFDMSEHMLGLLRAKLDKANNLTVTAADNRALPLENAVADVAVAGWSFGHSVGWYPDRWRAEIGKSVAELLRVLRPGGTAIILETLGTGNETPAPPNQGLAQYYQFLEQDYGFSGMSLRTDYRFESPAEGQALLRFFFGDELADRIVAEQRTILPECTGIWWRTIE